IAATVTLAALIQLVPSARGERTDSGEFAVHPRGLFSYFVNRVVGGGIVGDRFVRGYHAVLGQAGVAFVAAVVLAALVVAALRARSRPQAAGLLFLVGAAVVLMAIPMALRGFPTPAQIAIGGAHGRYMAVPGLCILVGLIW